MKRYSVLLAVTFGLASCGGGGGGSSAVPGQSGGQNPTSVATPAPGPAATPAPGGFAPTSLPLRVSPYTLTASVDPTDAHAVALTVPAGGAGVPPAQVGKVHVFPVQTGVTASTRAKRPLTFINSPFDVSYYGGFVVGGAVSHNIYVSTNYQSCSSTCWGNPGQFLTDLGSSTFIGHLDQYIGTNTPNRYTKGTAFTASATLLSSNPGRRNPVISQDDLLLMVYYAALNVGGGYGHIFHLFLHPNLDTCIDFASDCYSPDNPQSFTFCAYHGSVDYGGGRHFLYTVEPFQDVPGCGIVGGPNAVQGGDDVADSTDSTLSHELFETITDPDPYSGWFDGKNLDEIGDPCRSYIYTANLSGTNYALQSEYSDVDHACIN
jgi:hypothetical protein